MFEFNTSFLNIDSIFATLFKRADAAKRKPRVDKRVTFYINDI